MFSKRALSSAGRAPDLHSGGQRFDPARVHQFFQRKNWFLLSLKASHGRRAAVAALNFFLKLSLMVLMRNASFSVLVHRK